MYTPKWNIGIDLYRNKIQLVATRYRRKYWSLCECWQHQLPFDITDRSEHEQRSILLEILIQWRQKLPKNCAVSIALPSVRTLKQQFPLSAQMNLQQPELGWYIQSRAEKLFPAHAEELVVDYRVIKQHVYLNGARKSEITFWQNLLNESGFSLLAIDVAPIALRYVARHSGLPNECWLVHYRQGEWLWSGPISQPINYNHIQDSEITTLSQLIPLLSDDENALKLPIYCITDHPNIFDSPDHQNNRGNKNTTASQVTETLHHWNLRQAFQHHNLKIPHQLGDFVIAAGLALRHGDI